MLYLLSFFITFLSFAQSPDVVSLAKQYQSENKKCLITYGIQDNDKPQLFKSLEQANYVYFSEEGNLLVTWGEKEKQQLATLTKNKIEIDKILDKGFDPNNVHPKVIEQLNLLKELTSKCK
jgi:biopolymer transport protein ExbD